MDTPSINNNNLSESRIPLTKKQRIYKFYEGDGSTASTIFIFFSICFVLISVLGLVLGSIHEFQIPIKQKHKPLTTNDISNSDNKNELFNKNGKMIKINF